MPLSKCFAAAAHCSRLGPPWTRSPQPSTRRCRLRAVRRESGVTLRLKEGGGLLAETKTVAVVWFGGYAGADEVARRESELLERVRESEWQAVDADAKPYLLQYNDPFTAPWARRNEVAIPVKRA